MPIWGMWLLCLGLLVVRALIAAAESALYGVSDQEAQELCKLHPAAGARVLRHKTEREAVATSFRVGMVIFGFVAAALGALLVWPTFGVEGGAWGWPLAGALAVAFSAALLDVSFRALAAGNPAGWALGLSGMVSLLVLTVYPLMRLLVAALNLLARPFGGQVRFESPPPPLDELEKLLAAQAAKEGLDKSAPELIHQIFELSDKVCRDVMVSRTEVVSVEVSTPPSEILELLAEENHSRIPVYREDVDHIIGVLHARDLIPMLQHPELIVIADIVRPAHYVPWMKPIGDLLREMQKKKIHMAIVVDEHGGFMGIVTLEDILREIVGDIGDEFEVEEKQVEKLADGSFVIDAGLEVEGFATAVGFPLPEGDYETVGGFLSSRAGSIPDVGDRFTFNGWQFHVQSKDGARLERVRISRSKSVAPPAKDTRTTG